MRITAQKYLALRGTVRPAIAITQLNRIRVRKMLDRIDLLYSEQDLLEPGDPRRNEIDDEVDELFVQSQEIS